MVAPAPGKLQLWEGFKDLLAEIHENRSWPRCLVADPHHKLRKAHNPTYPGHCTRFLAHWGDHRCEGHKWPQYGQ